MGKNKITVEVWTDIMCPYCHIGKIYFERALRKFDYAQDVELHIKAFQLNPALPGNGQGYPVTGYLMQTAGYSPEAMRQMFAGLEKIAADAGVPFNLPNAVAANTRDAHRLIKLAAQKGLDSHVASMLGKAYFEDAKDYSDHRFLLQTGVDAGLDADEVRQMLSGNQFVHEVEQDIAEAERLGIDTVPTFLFNRSQAVIGSESEEVFLQALNNAYEVCGFSDGITKRKGRSCSADGVCEI